MFKGILNVPELPDSGGALAAASCPSSNVLDLVCTPEVDDLAREVYGILGMPIDVLDRVSTLKKILHAAETRRTFLLSTPNVNFLTRTQRDSEFRESLINSDLCAADGMPIVWLSRLLAIPIKERVSGADLFDAIRTNGSVSDPVRIFLFGGAEGVAQKVCETLNSRPGGIRCVGWIYPGFGTVEQMSGEGTIHTINASKADLLAVFLSAKKAQAWLLHNHDQLRVPVRAQLGATINYQAGTVRRAPRAIQKIGFEWLWRIKEEPYLWRRYLRDGFSLFNLFMFRVLPISLGLWLRRSNGRLILTLHEQEDFLVVRVSGHATKDHATETIACFRGALAEGRDVVIDLSEAETIDTRFFGLLLMLRKGLKSSERNLIFRGASKSITRLFYLHGFEFLLKRRAANG